MSWFVSRPIWLYGPEPTGFGFVKVATFLTFDQTCCGTTSWRFSCAAMNCESGVLSVIATPFGPLRLTDWMFVPGRVRPMMSMTLSCLPAVRL